MVDAFAPHDKILIDELSVRTPVREPQPAEQLVDAPSIVSFVEVIRQLVEQIVNIPVPRGGVRRPQGFPPEHVDIPVPHGQGLQGFLQGHGSTASSSSSHVPAGAVNEPFQGFFSHLSP